eukprot:m51a1_g9683 hypothetical protein (448) ;mRNA; r:1300897-1302889
MRLQVTVGDRRFTTFVDDTATIATLREHICTQYEDLYGDPLPGTRLQDKHENDLPPRIEVGKLLDEMDHVSVPVVRLPTPSSSPSSSSSTPPPLLQPPACDALRDVLGPASDPCRRHHRSCPVAERPAKRQATEPRVREQPQPSSSLGEQQQQQQQRVVLPQMSLLTWTDESNSALPPSLRALVQHDEQPQAQLPSSSSSSDTSTSGEDSPPAAAAARAVSALVAKSDAVSSAESTPVSAFRPTAAQQPQGALVSPMMLAQAGALLVPAAPVAGPVTQLPKPGTCVRTVREDRKPFCNPYCIPMAAEGQRDAVCPYCGEMRPYPVPVVPGDDPTLCSRQCVSGEVRKSKCAGYDLCSICIARHRNGKYSLDQPHQCMTCHRPWLRLNEEGICRTCKKAAERMSKGLPPKPHIVYAPEMLRNLEQRALAQRQAQSGHHGAPKGMSLLS